VLLTYAAEADNKSGDLILIVGAQDAAAPPGFSHSTATPTNTPVPTPTPTVPPGVQTITINDQDVGLQPRRARLSTDHPERGTTYRLVFHNVDTVETTNPRHGFSGITGPRLPGNDNITLGSPDFSDPVLYAAGLPAQCLSVHVHEQRGAAAIRKQHAGMVGLIPIQ
jgi:hypothetical protein